MIKILLHNNRVIIYKSLQIVSFITSLIRIYHCQGSNLIVYIKFSMIILILIYGSRVKFKIQKSLFSCANAISLFSAYDSITPHRPLSLHILLTCLTTLFNNRIEFFAYREFVFPIILIHFILKKINVHS